MVGRVGSNRVRLALRHADAIDAGLVVFVKS
jgi:hypothetical protein